jgi:excisionase family DNA binding protein
MIDVTEALLLSCNHIVARNTEMTERWLSVDEIAEHLGVSRDTIYNWINGKNMPAQKIGKLWKFKVSEVDEWAKSAGETSGMKEEK